MIEYLTDMFSFLPKEAFILLIAMIPLIELKGAIPVGISLGMPMLESFFISYIGSCIPIPIILLLVRPILAHLQTHSKLKGLVGKITDKNEVNTAKIKKYGSYGLLLFVAIPLPGTGVWSGSLAAALLNLPIKKALPIICFGNLIAGILVMILSHGFAQVIG